LDQKTSKISKTRFKKNRFTASISKPFFKNLSLTPNMKAAIFTKYGPPSIVQIKEINKPGPKANEVLIKVHASTVNRTDCGFRSAEYFVSRFFTGLFKPRFQILGNEFAGEIEEIGSAVTTFKKGDKVFGFMDDACGGHAEYMTIAEHKGLTTIPEGMSFEDAAPLTEGSHYALCNIRAAKVQPGQKVLVNGGTGAIGSAAIQILKYFDAHVTAVCATPHLELVKSLGADKLIDYTQKDFTQTDEKYDFIFDAVGKSSFGKCKPLLNKNGIYISTELGKNGENIWLALFTPIFGGKKLLFPLPAITKADVVFLKQLAEAGKFKPVIDRTYDLTHIVDAYSYVEKGMKIGNVVIKVY